MSSDHNFVTLEAGNLHGELIRSKGGSIKLHVRTSTERYEELVPAIAQHLGVAPEQLSFHKTYAERYHQPNGMILSRATYEVKVEG